MHAEIVKKEYRANHVAKPEVSNNAFSNNVLISVLCFSHVH